MESGAAAPITVLVADDEPDARELMRTVLSVDGRFVVVGEACDGTEAARLAASTRPDVVVLDLAMPVMGGLDAIPAIRHSCPDTTIVVLTGMSSRAASDRALALGARVFIEKGVRPFDLADTIAALVNSTATTGEREANPL